MSYTIKFQKPASYQSRKYGQGTIGTSACGPAAVCNALANAGIADVSVPDMCALAVRCGARVEGGTVMATLLDACRSKYGITYETTSKNARLMEHLRAGGTAICWNGGGYPLFSNGGHFVAAVGVTASGLVVIADSLYYDGKWGANSTRLHQVHTTSQRGIVNVSIDALGKSTADRSPSYFLISERRTDDMTDTEVRSIVAAAAAEAAEKAVSAWAQTAWDAVTASGLLDGTAPRSPITREQFAAVLYKMGYGSNNTPSTWAQDAWDACTAAGVFDGSDPHVPLTREQAAVVLQHLGLIGGEMVKKEMT